MRIELDFKLQSWTRFNAAYLHKYPLEAGALV